MTLTSVLSAEHTGSPAPASLVEGVDVLISARGWRVVGPDQADVADAYIGVADVDSDLHIRAGWQHMPAMILKPDVGPDGNNGCLARVWFPPMGEHNQRTPKSVDREEQNYQTAGSLDALIAAFLADAERFYSGRRSAAEVLFSMALERAEDEISSLLDLVDQLARMNDALSQHLRDAEGERNQLRSLLEAMGHQNGCKTKTPAKWIAKAAGAVVLSLGSGYAAGYAQANATPPVVVNVSVPAAQTGNGDLDAQLVRALNACIALEQVADDGLPATG